jgi:uncharacterized protein (TIRG00374 family)
LSAVLVIVIHPQELRLALSSKQLRQFMIWLVIGIALYGATVVYSGVDEMGESLARFGLGGWCAIVGLSTLNIGLRFVRWQNYLHTLGHRVATNRSLQYFLAGFAFTSTPAKAGEAARSLYLKKDGVSYTDSLAALFVERLTDLIAVILLALGAAYQFEDYRWLVLLAGVMTLAILPMIHSQLLRDQLRKASARVSGQRLGDVLKHGVKLINSSARLLKSGPLYSGMLLSMLAAFSVSLMMYVALSFSGVEISLSLAVGIYATGILAGALSFLPGGIGSAELVMIGLLGLAGVALPTATAVTLMCRVASLWYSIAIGIVIVLRLGTTNKGVQVSG